MIIQEKILCLNLTKADLDKNCAGIRILDSMRYLCFYYLLLPYNNLSTVSLVQALKN